MKAATQLLIPLMVGVFLLFTSCVEAPFTFGPFKPILDTSDIIMLGNNSKFVAFNIQTRTIVETYQLPRSFVAEYIYTGGHLVLTVAATPGSGARPLAYNVDIASGKVVEHTIPVGAQTYMQSQSAGMVEALGNGGFRTYLYDPASNRLTATFEHPIQHNSSPALLHGSTMYWFPDAYPIGSAENDNYRYLLTADNTKIPMGNENPLIDYWTVSPDYLGKRVVSARYAFESSTVTLEKLVSLIPLVTTTVFTYPPPHLGGFNRVIPWQDKLIVFSAQQVFLIDQTGSLLSSWGNFEDEIAKNPDYRIIEGKNACKIVGDTLYTWGQRFNYSDGTVPVNCCVAINLITYNAEWIELWNGY